MNKEKSLEEKLQESVDRIMPQVLEVCNTYGYKMYDINEIGVDYDSPAENLGVAVRREFDDVTYNVYLNKTLLNSGVQEVIDDVIAHELFHCVEKCFDHGSHWKMLTNFYNIKFDANIDVYSNRAIANNKSLRNEVINDSKYVIECTECKSLTCYLRNTKNVKRVRDGYTGIRCGTCSGKLNLIKDIKKES